jgi:DNA-binding NarL/FixJ family response regulator
MRLPENTPSVSLILGGFSPLEILGWELLSSRHPHLHIAEKVNCSSQLQDFISHRLEEIEEAKVVLVVQASAGDFFLPDLAETNRSAFRRVPTLVLADPDPEFVYRIHRLDISGLIPLRADEEEILTSLRKLCCGEKYFAAPVVDALVAYTYHQSRQASATTKERSFPETQPLSIRELEILRMVVRGKSAKEIAEELFLSVHTIYTHRKNILRKLACKNAAELVSYALDRGLLRESA